MAASMAQDSGFHMYLRASVTLRGCLLQRLHHRWRLSGRCGKQAVLSLHAGTLLSWPPPWPRTAGPTCTCGRAHSSRFAQAGAPRAGRRRLHAHCGSLQWHQRRATQHLRGQSMVEPSALLYPEPGILNCFLGGAPPKEDQPGVAPALRQPVGAVLVQAPVHLVRVEPVLRALCDTPPGSDVGTEMDHPGPRKLPGMHLSTRRQQRLAAAAAAAALSSSSAAWAALHACHTSAHWPGSAPRLRGTP